MPFDTLKNINCCAIEKMYNKYNIKKMYKRCNLRMPINAHEGEKSNANVFLFLSIRLVFCFCFEMKSFILCCFAHIILRISKE